MLKKISLSLVLVVAIFLAYVAFIMSPRMYFSREIVINATPDKIFPHINDSKKADAWMPWSESDPKMKMTYSGPAEGVGAKSNWTSDGDMGTGEALVIESKPNEVVKTQLTYTIPMTMQQLATISLIPKDGSTLVRWEIEGETPFVGRIFCFFMNMDKHMGPLFDKGLSKLKAIAEQP